MSDIHTVFYNYSYVCIQLYILQLLLFLMKFSLMSHMFKDVAYIIGKLYINIPNSFVLYEYMNTNT